MTNGFDYFNLSVVVSNFGTPLVATAHLNKKKLPSNWKI